MAYKLAQTPELSGGGREIFFKFVTECLGSVSNLSIDVDLKMKGFYVQF